LDAVIDYLPSPVDLDEVKGINPKTNLEEIRKLIPEMIFADWLSKFNRSPCRKAYLFSVYSG